ncbi:hypothetical protein ACIQXD_33320 [Streptomyces uncialis]|uniref:hypothetical protein n=1 Tax=Streptomyces uncialis TaxID=1048205 RepID=UPI0037FCE8A6
MRIGVTGHRGLPGSVETAVRALLADEAERQAAVCGSDGLVAVSCPADRPDSWWADLVLAAGGRLEAVVPADDHRTGLTGSTPQAHQAGSEILVGLCHALVAVWDGLPARGCGGTADAVAHGTGTPVTVLWPEGAAR